jgi:excisionase family DNA binding protein
MNIEKKVLTPKDLQKITGKSLRLIYRELRKNNIPHVKMGTVYLIGEDAFYRWLEGQSTPPAGTGTAGAN